MKMQCIMCDNVWDRTSESSRCPECGMFGRTYLWPVGSHVKSTVPFEHNGVESMFRGTVRRTYSDGQTVVMLSAASQDKLGALSIIVPNHHLVKQ